jgi:hypothetical protein
MAIGFYKIQDKLGVKAIYNHADFRLISRRALQQLSLYQEKNLYLRGIIPLMGYKSAIVEDVISERIAGKSKYTLKKMLKLAVDGITSFSTRPMHLIFVYRILVSAYNIRDICVCVDLFFTHHIVPGWTSLMLSLWFIGSVVLLSIGIVGEYIGNIYIEIKQRPLYNIDENSNQELKEGFLETEKKEDCINESHQ